MPEYLARAGSLATVVEGRAVDAILSRPAHTGA